MYTSFVNHADKVKEFLDQFNKIKGAVVLEKKTSNLFRRLKKSHKKLDFSNFCEVLSISPDGFADVEGAVTMEKLASETLKHGFVSQVTIELKTITVGGAVSGIAIESSSFKYGLFHQTVEEMEVLVPTGEIVVCSRSQNSDLFYAMPNSYGTLGYILRLKIRLIKAKKYVSMKYFHYTDIGKCMDDLEKLSSPDEKHDFIDGVVFGRNDIVIALGTFTDVVPYTSDYTYMKIYYKSLKDRTEDYLITKNYLFRWDTDWWWGSQSMLLQYKFIRFLVGKWLLNSKSYSRIMHLEQKYNVLNRLSFIFPQTESVIQDIGIPRVNWEKFLDFLLDEIKILPIWLCPFAGSLDFPLFPLENKTYLDFGFWGNAPTKGKDGQWNKLVEKKTFELKGVKSLYSQVTYSEEQFWKNSNKEAYEKVKSKYDPKGKLKGLYQEVINR